MKDLRNYKGDNMKKFFIIFLIFVLFFNCLFFSISGKSFAEDSIGAKDRLRSLIGDGKKGINYTYSSKDGFTCKPGGILFYGGEKGGKFNECQFSKGGGMAAGIACLNDIGVNVGVWAWDVIVEVLLAPVLCISSFYTVANFINSKNAFLSLFAPLLILFVSSGIDKLTEIIAGEDDFSLDPTNKTPICQSIYWGNFAVCIAMFLIFKLPKKNVQMTVKIAMILGLSAVFYIIKKTLALVQYNKASQDFNTLALCGDEWLTYGSPDLESYLGTEIGVSVEITLDKINSSLTTSINQSKSFPTKGSFFGSYKYALDKCFRDKSVDFCNLVIQKENGKITVENIDNYLDVKYKQYREFLYGGVEYANNFDSNCIDPRPERKTYEGVKKGDTKSQLYYFRGTESANFACDRFLEKNTDEYLNAYKCCIEASQKTICIRNRNESVNGKLNYNGDVYVFCSIHDEDGDCSLSTGVFTANENSNVKIACEQAKSAIEGIKNGITTNGSESGYYSYYKTESGLYYKCPKGSGPDNYFSGCTNIEKDEYSENTFSISPEDQKEFDKNVDRIDYSSVCDYEPKNTDTVSFKIKRSDQSISGEYEKYCVETYNLCPYNFPILGGTEQVGQDFMSTTQRDIPVSYKDGTYREDYGSSNENVTSKLESMDTILNCEIKGDETSGFVKECGGKCIEKVQGKRAGEYEIKILPCYNKPSNFCQIDRHCVYIKKFEPSEVNINSPYVSTACINGVGSSHNFINYSRSYGGATTRVFTAPFVECFVETFKNMLLNKAGHTKCLISGEKPDLNNTCLSGEEYKEGENLEKYNIDGPFKKLQENLMEIVKIILAIAIVLYGFKIIIKNNSSINVEDITQFILTSVFVVYFTMTTSWKEPVFNAVYGTSNYIVNLSSKIIRFDRVSSTNYDSIYKNPNYQGCYFFKHDEIPNNYEDYGIGKSYLALFDTLDCKISRYFGITTDNVINIPIISFFIAGIFSFGFAIMTIMPFILLTIGIIAIAIKIALQFITYSLELTILLFIAPLIIPLYLIENTRGIFNSWINNIVKLIFRPMFTILSTMLFLLIFDKYYIGDAKFYGIREPVRDIYCGKICKIDNNNFYYIYENPSNSSEEAASIIQECEERAKGKVIDLGDESPMCIVSSQEIVGNSGSSLVDMFISGFAGFPSVISNSLDFFKIFSDMIFLLLLLGIFDRFINEAGIEIFGKLGETDFTVSGILSKASSVMIKIANITNVLPKKGIKEIMANKTEFNSNRTDNKIKRKIGADYYDENKDAIHNESLEKPKEK